MHISGRQRVIAGRLALHTIFAFVFYWVLGFEPAVVLMLALIATQMETKEDTP